MGALRYGLENLNNKRNFKSLYLKQINNNNVIKVINHDHSSTCKNNL